MLASLIKSSEEIQAIKTEVMTSMISVYTDGALITIRDIVMSTIALLGVIDLSEVASIYKVNISEMALIGIGISDHMKEFFRSIYNIKWISAS